MSELADEVLRIVHAFSDDDRRNAVRQLAARIAYAERRLAQAERVVAAADVIVAICDRETDAFDAYKAERAKMGEKA